MTFMQKIRTYLVPALAVFGAFSAVRAVSAGNQTPPVAIPVAPPPRAPFEHFVAGAGIIEASSENISIGAPVGGIIQAVPVTVGQSVQRGDPLLQIDDRAQQAKVRTAEAQVLVARANLNQANTLLALVKKIPDRRAVSEELLVQRTAGADTATAEVARAEAALIQERTELERLTIRSPISGKVLQVRARVGEFAPASQLSSSPLMIVGTVDPLHVRVDIDENDAWRMKPGAQAEAFLRGNSQIKFKLAYVRFEPYVVPKRSLTGESTERVDTRVMQAIYRFNEAPPDIYVGQLLDVYIAHE